MWDQLRANLYPWRGTMPVIEVAGSPRKMGREYGARCAPIIEMVAEAFVQGLSQSVGLGEEALLEEAREYLPALDTPHGRRYVEEMSGIAEGSGVSYDRVLALNCGWDLLNSLPTPETHSDYMCSSFAAWGSQTREGHLICGHNDDGARFFDQFLVLLAARPEGGNAFVTPIVPGYIGYHRMWNDRGCAVLGLALEKGCPNEDFEHNVPMWILFRDLVQHSDSAAAALERLRTSPPSVPINILLSDSTGEGRLVQTTAKHRVELEPEAETLVCTNHALDERIAAHLILHEVPSGTDHRYDGMRALVATHRGEIDIETAKAIQSSHLDSADGSLRPGVNCPCTHYEYEGRHAGTVSAVALDISETEAVAHVSLGNPCEGRWIEHVLPLRVG